MELTRISWLCYILLQEKSTEDVKELRRRETVDPVWYTTMQIQASLPPKEYQQYFPQVHTTYCTQHYMVV